jgi:hypothetical protein
MADLSGESGPATTARLDSARPGLSSADDQRCAVAVGGIRCGRRRQRPHSHTCSLFNAAAVARNLEMPFEQITDTSTDSLTAKY